MNSYNEIRKQLDDMKIIDSFERLNTFEKTDEQNDDMLSKFVMHFLQQDLISAGMNENQLNTISDPDVNLDVRLKIAKPFIDVCMNLGHGRAFKRSMEGLYGLDPNNLDLEKYFNNSCTKCYDSDYLFNIMRNKCHIETALLDDNDDDRFHCDKRLFKRIFRPEKYIKPGPISGEVIRWVESHYTQIDSLDDWVTSFDEELNEVTNHGISVLKVDLSSARSLKFEDISYNVAKKAFDEMLNVWRVDGRGARDHVEFPVEVQDFMLHRVLSSLRGRDAVIQFDVGIQHDNRDIVSNAHPLLLNSLFEHYTDVKFDLLHIGWPWWRDVLALAKMYPNVMVNFAGAHLISPLSSVHCLAEAIDTVPLNKIIGFGGNYLFADGVYGQLEIAKDNIARALSSFSDYNIFSLSESVELARTILYDNPKKFYNL